MEYKVEKMSLIEYLKGSFKEIINFVEDLKNGFKEIINEKKEETDIANMDTISEKTREQLLNSLNQIEKNASEFTRREEISETVEMNNKKIKTKKQSNLYQNEVVPQYTETESIYQGKDER